MGKIKTLLLAALCVLAAAGCAKKNATPFERAQREKDPAKAYQLYERIISENPRHSGALIERGKLKMGQDSYTRAAEDFTAALQVDPGVAGTAYDLRAQAYTHMKALNKALADVNRAAAANVKSLNTLDMLGQALIAAGRPREAINVYRLATSIKAAENEMRVRLGEAYAAANDLPAAIREFSEVIAVYPDKAGKARLGRCRAQVTLRQPRAALADCETAAQEGVPEALLLSAEIYRALGDHAAAIISYRNYTDRSPQDTQAAVALADLLYTTGEYAQAADIYSGAVRRYASPARANRRAVLSLMRADKCGKAGPLESDLIKRFYTDGEAYAAVAAYQSYCENNTEKALQSLGSAFELGFDDFAALGSDGEYGFFLTETAKTPGYAELVESARKNTPRKNCPVCASGK